MKRKTRARDLRALCAETHEDDGVDPRQQRTRAPFDPSQDRKCLQLSRTAARAVAAGLASCNDVLLEHVHVLFGEPAPDSTRIRILLALDVRETRPEVVAALRARVESRLSEMRGWLRSVVAADITRKRAPELCFGWAAAGEVDADA